MKFNGLCFRSFLFLGLSLVLTLALAADLMREQRIAAEIEDAILVGEPIRLQAGEVSFFAIHAEAETDRLRGAVILLHGRGANPDWNDVIKPLRTRLPEAGWETLSLQMPVAASDAPDRAYRALIPEAGPRIDAAVEFFRQRGFGNIVLLGHSLGSRMGLAWLAAGAPEEIRAFVAVGLPVGRGSGGQEALAALEKVKIPMLDIYGSQDIGAVRRSVRARAQAARRAGNSGYRQVEVAGADHFFRGLEDTLVLRVRAWIARVAPGVAVEKKESNGASGGGK
jgi:pimeloyl-ACP methyl ester carboxylesterase